MKKIGLLLVSLIFVSSFPAVFPPMDTEWINRIVDSAIIIPTVQITNCISIPIGIIHGTLEEIKHNGGKKKIVSLIKEAGKGAIKGAHVGTVAGLFAASLIAYQTDKMATKAVEQIIENVEKHNNTIDNNLQA